MNLLQNAYDITHLAFGMLLHYLWKLKPDVEENANRLHF